MNLNRALMKSGIGGPSPSSIQGYILPKTYPISMVHPTIWTFLWFYHHFTQVELDSYRKSINYHFMKIFVVTKNFYWFQIDPNKPKWQINTKWQVVVKIRCNHRNMNIRNHKCTLFIHLTLWNLNDIITIYSTVIK